MLDDEEISKLATCESEREIEKHDGELMQILAKWFDKPLSELPEQQRRYAGLYVQDWSALSTAERRACAIEADRKIQQTIALRFQQERREQEGLPSDRFAQRAMQDGFDKATREKAGESDFESQVGKVNMAADRCMELSRRQALTIRDWRALTGLGRGWAGAYLITSESVTFRKWTPEDMAGWSDDDQDEMDADNLTAPLEFPCTPAELLRFVDTVRHDLYGFRVPDAFRQAVTGSAKKIENGLLVSNDAPETEGSSASEASDKASPIGTTADDMPMAYVEEMAQAPAPKDDQNDELASLFDPVKVAQLEAMFPDGGKWTEYAARAHRNGLKAARIDSGRFNPYRAALWWFAKGPNGWKWERGARVLAKNLPPRSRGNEGKLTGELD